MITCICSRFLTLKGCLCLGPGSMQPSGSWLHPQCRQEHAFHLGRFRARAVGKVVSPEVTSTLGTTQMTWPEFESLSVWPIAKFWRAPQALQVMNKSGRALPAVLLLNSIQHANQQSVSVNSTLPALATARPRKFSEFPFQGPSDTSLNCIASIPVGFKMQKIAKVKPIRSQFNPAFGPRSWSAPRHQIGRSLPALLPRKMAKGRLFSSRHDSSFRADRLQHFPGAQLHLISRDKHASRV